MEVLFLYPFLQKGGDANGYQRQKTKADRHEGAGRQSGQASAEHQRTEAQQESTGLSEVAGAGSKERVAQTCQTDGSHRHPDRSGHGGLCRLLSGICRWKEAEEFITQHGTIVKTPSGYWQQVPQVSIAQTYLKIMNKFAEQFGLTPSSRSRIIASDGGPADAADEMENLLGGGGS